MAPFLQGVATYQITASHLLVDVQLSKGVRPFPNIFSTGTMLIPEGIQERLSLLRVAVRGTDRKSSGTGQNRPV